MLDAFIIEQIRKRERIHEDQRPRLDLPLPAERLPRPEDTTPAQDDSGRQDDQRGVVIIDL